VPTLLLADDSVTIQRVIELTFADEDIDVVAVSDGDQAIARLDTIPPDILLVDVGMPGKSGYEVAAYVKQTPKLAHIPVVLLTGAFEPVDQVKANAAGCDGVLAKPFEPQLVIERVKDLLGRPGRPAGVSGDVFKAPPARATELWPAFTSSPAAEPAAGSRKIDDYFDELDAAFTILSGKPASDATAARAAAPPVEVDWFGLKAEAASEETLDVSIAREEPGQQFWTRDAEDLSIAPKEPQPPPPAPESEWVEASPAPSLSPTLSQTPSTPSRQPSLPPLADAFAALLEAEQHEPEASVRPAWPSAPVSGPAVTDDLVAQVSQRVLEQLTDRALRDAVSERVSAIAERLIREEIERIKSSIE
jgi:CheY-like chemotaxis protein